MSSLHLPAMSVFLLPELTPTFNIFLKEWALGLGSSNYRLSTTQLDSLAVNPP